MPRREHVGGAPATALASGILAAATSFTVDDGSGYPTGAVGPFFVVIDPGFSTEEKILCSSRSGNNFTVAGSGRGADNTVASDHAVDAVVKHVLAALEVDEHNAHVNANSGVHGVAGAVVGTTDVQTLTNKTISGASNTLSNVPQSAVTSLVADLAAKVDDSQIHASWLTALGLPLDADAATVLGALATGWPGILAVAPGANWPGALAAGLDADAASLLANIANSWVAVLQATLGTNWNTALAAALAGDWANVLDSPINGGWLNVFAVDPASLRPVQADDSTNLLNLSNTTEEPGSPVVGVVFVAPPSGKVEVIVSGYIQSELDGQSIVLGWDMKTGGTIGSGTAVLSLSDDRAIIAGEVVNASSPNAHGGSSHYVHSGLTAGSTYNARCMHYVTGGTVHDIFARRICVKPVL